MDITHTVDGIDAREVDDEAREAVIGLSKQCTLLYVAFVWRDAIRLISARKATKPERRIYEEQ